MTLPLDLGLLESDEKFQQLCFYLARKEFPNAIQVASSWDGGRDIFLFNDGMGDVIWQCKFTKRSLNELKPKIVDSLAALDPSRKISRWILCLSINASGTFLDWLRGTISTYPFIKSLDVWGRETLLERLDQYPDVLEVFVYPVWKALESRFRTEELELIRYDVEPDCGWKAADLNILCFTQKGAADSDLVLDVIVRNRGTIQSLVHSIRRELTDVHRHLRGMPGTGLLWRQHTYALSLHGGEPGTRMERLEPPLVVDSGTHQRFNIKIAATGYAWTGYLRLTMLYGNGQELALPWIFLKA